MADQDDWVDVPLKKKPQDSADWQDVPIGSKKVDATDGIINDYVLPGMRAVGGAGLEAMNSAFGTVDKYLGAPVRAGVQQAARGEFGKVLPAMASQFGEDPSKAPSGKDIAIEQGLSGEDKYNTGLILNPFTNETLKMSPAGIAGGVGEAVTDPLNFLPVGKAVKGVGKLAQLASKGVGKSAEFATPIIGKLVARVPADVTKEYMANRLRIKGIGKGRSYENLKDMLDDAIIGIRDNVESSRDAKSKLQESLKQKMREKKFDLQRGIGAPKITDAINASMEQQKRILGELSEKAEDILAQSGKTYRRDDLLGLLDKIGKEAANVSVGDTISDALSSFYRYRERVAGLPQVLDAPTIRDVFRQIRQDTKRVDKAGAFNKDLDQMRMAFSEKASDVVKGDIPEYAGVMEKAHPMAQSLQEMRKYFGTPEETTATLESIRKGTSDVSKIKEGIVRRNAELFQNPEIASALDEYEKNRQILERINKGDDLSGELFPRDVAALQKAQAEQDFLQKLYRPVRRLNPDSDKTQAVIKRFGSPGSSIADRRAVEQLGKVSGVDFPQMFRDKNVYESFNKDATAGSRNVNALGKVGGYIADRFGGPLLRTGIDVGQNVKGGIDKLLYYMQNDPKFAATYGKMINRVAKGEIRGIVLYHHMLINNDPEYRKYFEEGAQ